MWDPVAGCGRSLLRLCPPVSSERVPGGHCGTALCPWKCSRKSMTFSPACPTKSAGVCGPVRVGHVAAETLFPTSGLRHPPRGVVAGCCVCLSPHPAVPASFSSSARSDRLGDPGAQPSPLRLSPECPALAPTPPGDSLSPSKPWLTSPPRVTASASESPGETLPPTSAPCLVPSSK